VTDEQLIAAARKAGLCYIDCWDFEDQPERLEHLRAFAAALAVPKPVEPTVMEIIELHNWLEDEWRANNDGEDLPMVDFARAVLARWGRPFSPGAQAVLDAYGDFEAANTDAMAAALRAVADRLHRRLPWPDDVEGIGVGWATGELLAIAAELEGSDG
jgi:hypothetical protein